MNNIYHSISNTYTPRGYTISVALLDLVIIKENKMKSLCNKMNNRQQQMIYKLMTVIKEQERLIQMLYKEINILKETK